MAHRRDVTAVTSQRRVNRFALILPLINLSGPALSPNRPELARPAFRASPIHLPRMDVLSRRASGCFIAFDLLWLNGEDLRQQPLIDRKNRLHDLICAHQHMRLIYAQHIEGKGREFFREACARDLEGIVAKRKNSVYRDDGTGWLKIKNPRYSQAEGRHELWTRRK